MRRRTAVILLLVTETAILVRSLLVNGELGYLLFISTIFNPKTKVS